MVMNYCDKARAQYPSEFNENYQSMNKYVKSYFQQKISAVYYEGKLVVYIVQFDLVPEVRHLVSETRVEVLFNGLLCGDKH